MGLRVNHPFSTQLAQKCSLEVVRPPKSPLLGASWGHFGTTLAPTWSHLAPSWAFQVPFGCPKSSPKPPKVTQFGTKAHQRVPSGTLLYQLGLQGLHFAPKVIKNAPPSAPRTLPGPSDLVVLTKGKRSTTQRTHRTLGGGGVPPALSINGFT